jgi:putative acetyltransferase
MIIRRQQPDDYEAIRHVYAEAFREPGFRPPLNAGCVSPEVGLFEALWKAGDTMTEFSFTALDDKGVVGHATASKATVANDPVVAVGPIGVLPIHQGGGIGSALMDAVLTACDAADVPLVVLLGSPDYYDRFGFRPAAELGVMPPDASWGSSFQARPLRAYTPSVTGPFAYAPAFSA